MKDELDNAINHLDYDYVIGIISGKRSMTETQYLHEKIRLLKMYVEAVKDSKVHTGE